MWESEYILAQLIHSYPVCNSGGFKGEKQVPAKALGKGLLSERRLCTCSGSCWLLQCCTIMGNKDNICPQSQERTNILSTSKSSLIWQGRRGWRLSCTHVSCRGRGEGLLGEPSTCVNLYCRCLTAHTLQRAPWERLKRLFLSRCLCHYPSSHSNHPDAILLPLSLPDLGRWGISVDILGMMRACPVVMFVFYSLILHHLPRNDSRWKHYLSLHKV